MMTCGKKGAGKTAPVNIEKLTDEKLNEVTGGAGNAESCFPTMVECEPQHGPHCKPLTPPWEKK